MSRLGFSALMLIVLAACASKPTYEFDYDQNFDFSSFKTYHWYDDMVRTRESEYRKFNPSDKRIREVVGRELARHNLRESSSAEADFWINYNVSKHRQQIVHTTGYDQGSTVVSLPAPTGPVLLSATVPVPASVNTTRVRRYSM